jgi:hypothetical protein
MTSHGARRAAGGRLLAVVLAGIALSPGFVRDAVVAAQQTPIARPPSAPSKQEGDADRLRNYVDVRSSVDRGAVWIGDRFSYIVDIGCSHGIDILTDDLSRDRLRLEGLEVIGLEQTREDRGDGITVYRFTYRLTTYRPEPATERIGDMTVRYYLRRPGQRPEDVVPAGEVVVPGALVAVRSLLPDARDTANFRSAQPPLSRAAVFAILQRLGIGLVIVSIVPAVLWIVALLRQLRHRRPRPSVKRLRHDEHASLDAVRALDVETEAGRREAFDRLSALVRKHLSGAWGVPADGLTPAQLESALAAHGTGEVSALAISLLDTCEKAKYGRPDELPPRGACQAAIDQAGQLIGTGRS